MGIPCVMAFKSLMKFISLTVFCGAALTSCSGNTADSKADFESSITTSDSLSTPNSSLEESDTLNVTDAGAVYLEIIQPVNCAAKVILDFQQENTMGDGTFGGSLPELTSAMASLAAARQVAFRSLMSEKWPAVIASDIEIMAREWAKQANAEEFISTSVDRGMFNSRVAEYQDLRSKSTSNPGFIRATLGIGPASETDRC